MNDSQHELTGRGTNAAEPRSVKDPPQEEQRQSSSSFTGRNLPMQVRNSERAPPLPGACRQVVWPAFFSRAVDSTAASLAFTNDETIECATSPNSGTPSNRDRPLGWVKD